MAKLLTYYDLCSISDHKEFLGIAEDCDSGSIINTLTRNIFFTIQLSNQLQANSWTALEKLSNKVIYDFKSDKYVGVFGHRYLRLWSKDVKDINKVKKIKIPNTIHDLITIDRKETLVMYKDGTCESLEASIENRKLDKNHVDGNCKPIIDAETQTISNVACLKAFDNILLTYFAKNNQTNEVEFIYYQLDSDSLSPDGKIIKFKITRPQQDTQLMGYTVVDGDMHPNLITIWSDKRIFMLPLNSAETNEHDSIGYFVSMLNDLSVAQPLTMVGVSKDCIAIFGGNAHQEGSSLVLFNTRFSVVQSKQFFKVYFNNAKFWICGNHILLAFGHTLACVSFRISKEQLSDMIGSQRTNELKTIINKDCINEEIELEEEASMRSKERKGVEQIEQPTDKLPFDAQSVDQVVTQLQSLYSHNVVCEIHKIDSDLSSGIQTKLCTNVCDTMFCTDLIQMLTAELERYGASDLEITEKLIPVLIETNKHTELVICLRKYANISDKMLVKSLKYFLNTKSTTDDDQTASENKKQQINAVFSCSFNEDLIKEHLRTELNLEEVIFLLEDLAQCIQKADQTLMEMPQLGDGFDDDMQLVAWFSIILDAHYQQFILSRNVEFSKMIGAWKEVIDQYVVDIRELKTLSPLLYNLVKGKSTNSQKQSSKWYSVEAVKLY